MLKGEQQVELATLRLELRSIDAEIAGMRRDSRRYRQMRFGLDIKEIQLIALLDQRDACARRIAHLRKELRLPDEHKYHLLSWLLLPIAGWLYVQKLLTARAAAPQVEPEPTAPVAVTREHVAAGVADL